MQNKIVRLTCLLIALLALAITASAQSTSFTYQGYLTDNGNPATGLNDFYFRLYDAPTGGTEIGSSVIIRNLGVTNGLFTAVLDFGPAFNGSARFLDIGVRPAASSGTFTYLVPRQSITSTPYAINAGALNGPLASGLVNGAHVLGTTDGQPLEFRVGNQRALRLESNGGGAPNVIGGSYRNFVPGNVEGATMFGGGVNNFPNSLEANFGTISGGLRNVIRIDALGATIGGGEDNRVQTNALYATIGGGGQNIIEAWYSTIGGGAVNEIYTNAVAATVGGGIGNRIHRDATVGTIGGGDGNIIEPGALYATIGGGARNVIRTNSSRGTIAGGGQNVIQSNAQYATVPGGQANSATNYGFAAGRRAKANHTGTFVWADSTDADFASTTNNQFLIRAANGLGLGTTNPQASLHVYSTRNPTVVRIQSSGAPGAGRIEFVSNPQGDVNEWRPGFIESTDNGGFTGGLSFVVNGTGFANRFAAVEAMRIVNGQVGIGTPTPVSPLHVVGTVTATAFNPSSDRNLKENLEPVTPRDVLDKVAALPISRWNFKGDEATPHVGPMAQDFHAAFRLGTDNKHIATVDADGIAFAAIQGLNQKLEDELTRRNKENAELKQRLEKLEQLMQAITRDSAEKQ